MIAIRHPFHFLETETVVPDDEFPQPTIQPIRSGAGGVDSNSESGRRGDWTIDGTIHPWPAIQHGESLGGGIKQAEEMIPAGTNGVGRERGAIVRGCLGDRLTGARSGQL